MCRWLDRELTPAAMNATYLADDLQLPAGYCQRVRIEPAEQSMDVAGIISVRVIRRLLDSLPEWWPPITPDDS